MPGAWRPPIVKTVASRGQGVAELVAELERHRAWMADGGELGRRRHARAEAEIEAIAVSSLRRQLDGLHGGSTLACLADAVVAGRTDPYRAADELLERIAAE